MVVRKPTVTIEVVTPAKANKWLAENSVNRKLRQSRVVQIAGDLTRGAWRLTGDAIVFDADGMLLNGQHRLTALAVSGKSAQFVVLRNLPTETMEVMDQGAMRSLGDTLKMRGYAAPSLLSAGLAFLYRFEYIAATGSLYYNDGARPTPSQLLDLLKREERRGVIDQLPLAQKLSAQHHFRTGATLAIVHLTYLSDPADAKEFWHMMLTGEGVKVGSPVYIFKAWLSSDFAASRTKGRAPDWRFAAYLIKTWNSYHSGPPLRRLGYMYTGRKQEPFPEIT